MDSRQHIGAILKQWLEMTHAETQAIRCGDWAALRKMQEAKSNLRGPLAEAIDQWRASNPEEAKSQPFRDEVSQLLSLETHNGCLLAARKRQAREKKFLLEKALYNLRRVRSSYARPAKLEIHAYS